MELAICKSTHFHLRSIGRIQNLLTFDATAQLIHALITTCLDFCNSILYNLPNNKIERSHHHHRFIVRFPIGLDFPLITLPFQEC